MTATINASTSAGVVTTADTSGILQLQTNGTAALTVDASQNVGVGTSSPNKRLNATKASSTAYSASDFDIDSLALQLANTTNDKSTGIYFAIGSNGEAAISAVETSDGETALTFGTRGSGARLERARFNSTGALVFAGGTTTADGIGITFPATQSASTNANTLDDYEEGTWTPAVSFGNGTTGITYTIQSGGYIKIGAQVTVWAQVNMSSKGSSTGSARITNLPFTNANASGRSEGASVVFNFWTNFSGTPIPLGYVQNNATTISISNGTASNSIPALADTNFTNTSNFYFNGTYSTV